MSTPPVPPRPDLAPEDRAAGWAVSPPDRPGVTRRAFEIWRRTLWVAASLTALLQGVPALLQRIMTPRTVGPNVISIWLRTGHFPRYLRAPQATPNPLVFPISLVATIVLIPLLYVALLRLMLGSSVGEPVDARRALACGGRLLGRTIVVGLCVILIVMAFGIPFGVVFLILVTNHLWQLGLVLLAVASVPVYAAVSLCLPALVVEGATGFAATARSRRLAWRSPRTFLLIGVVVVVLGAAAGLAAGFVVPHLMSAGGAELLVEGLVAMVITAFTVPLTGAFITSAYLEARARSGETVEPWMLAAALRVSDQR
jgi:hypothetical protein